MNEHFKVLLQNWLSLWMWILVFQKCFNLNIVTTSRIVEERPDITNWAMHSQVLVLAWDV
jgi:hypothetical protein